MWFATPNHHVSYELFFPKRQGHQSHWKGDTEQTRYSNTKHGSNQDRIWQEQSSNTIFSQQSGRGDARIISERARYVELRGRLVKWDPEPVRGRVSLTGFR